MFITKFRKQGLFFDWAQKKKSGSIPGSKGVEDAVNEFPAAEIKKTVNGSVVTLEGTYLGKPIRVRIFCEPEIKLSD